MDKSNKKLKITCGVLSGAILLSIFGFMFYAWYFGLTRNRKFKTNLTEDEIIANITKRTEEKFANEIVSGTTFTVELVYNFNEEKPEYFLVEFEGGGFSYMTQNEDGEIITVYPEDAYTMGYSGGGSNFYVCNSEDGTFNGTPNAGGKSAYTKQGLKSEKKYYARGIMAVKRNGKMVCVRDSGEYKRNDIIPRHRLEYLSRNEYRLPRIAY